MGLIVPRVSSLALHNTISIRCLYCFLSLSPVFSLYKDIKNQMRNLSKVTQLVRDKAVLNLVVPDSKHTFYTTPFVRCCVGDKHLSILSPLQALVLAFSLIVLSDVFTSPGLIQAPKGNAFPMVFSSPDCSPSSGLRSMSLPRSVLLFSSVLPSYPLSHHPKAFFIPVITFLNYFALIVHPCPRC